MYVERRIGHVRSRKAGRTGGRGREAQSWSGAPTAQEDAPKGAAQAVRFVSRPSGVRGPVSAPVAQQDRAPAP